MNTHFEDNIEKLLNNCNKERIQQITERLTASDVFIYGAGNDGRLTYQLLQKINKDIKAFFDKRAEELRFCMGKPVYRADSKDIDARTREHAAVIVAFLCSYNEWQKTKTWLQALGYKYVVFYHDIYYLLTTQTSNFNTDKQKIIEISRCFGDVKSKNIYYSFLNAVINVNCGLFPTPDSSEQYFVSDIALKKGYNRFIDCGAYNGDTVLALHRHKGLIEKIALFEPDQANFKRLTENIRDNRVAKEQILFPCGVWSQTTILRFRSGCQSASNIAEDGDAVICCVALDDVLRDFAPTFIKMDIEGAEYEALLGEQNIIKQYSPDLAICVYHKVEHIWEIPLLIKTFNPGYKLFLRVHGLHGMETVLYATCE